jgi:glycerophosphoryl diester phosphodiesterase
MMNHWLTTASPLIIGHRGASAEAPENTLAAFKLALAQGAAGIEFDVQVTADGVPVIIHDRLLDRTTNGRGVVTAHTAAQLQPLDAGQGERIPTLDQLFETFGRRLLYNLEIKNVYWRETGAEVAIAGRIQAHNLADRMVISSFNPLALKRIRPHLAGPALLALLRFSGPLQYTRYLFEGEAEHPHYPLVTEAYMANMRHRGRRVHVWTVDDPLEAQRLLRLGVHAIITNKPGFLKEQLTG